ncbi:sugar ABC transporter substrate-binding protein [Allokutzneria sp. A3M-2-11 16]|uniref:ABC transporter substrate-binding protein n=1 Tax=Allokutzneria sp. A3M-2-11 16 TaxID=2962043 RepID=UPI0020B73357|nr:sugar ABC transporter substrate-binding protein [Allokutzneria sp. A3M-2-11 16]MCP3804111.1 sugar ABC transporter substrate-binding protein [Allokutzneria sp. A3M-2-11 16]
MSGLSRRHVLGLGALAALSACGGPARGPDAPMTFWQFYAPAPQQTEYQQQQSRWFIELVEAWNSEHRRKIELVYVPVRDYLGGAKLPTAFATGAGPDIFLLSPGDFLRYYNGGALQDLTPHLSRQVIDDFMPGTLETRTVGGRVFGLPMEIEPMAMFYSTNAFEAAGLSEGDIPRTWDQLLGVARRLKAAGQRGMVFHTVPGYYQNFAWYPFLWSAGGTVTNPDGTSAFDSPATVRALSFWQEAVRSGVSPRTLPGEDDPTVAFSQGLVSLWHRGIWTVKELQDVPDVRYGVFPTPVPEGGSYTTSLGGWAFVANARGRDPEAAAEFCAFALGSQRPEAVQRIVDWCIKVKTDIPPRRSALDKAVAQGGFESGVMRTFLRDVLPGARGEPRLPPVAYKAVSDAIQATMLGGADPKAAASAADRAITAYLKTYRGAEF